MKIEKIIEILEGSKATKVIDLMNKYKKILTEENISYEQLVFALEYDKEVSKRKQIDKVSITCDIFDGTYISRSKEDIEYMTLEVDSINCVLGKQEDFSLYKKALELAREEIEEIDQYVLSYTHSRK